MTQTPIIVWVRRDLRLADHPALTAACESGQPVIAVYIHDDQVASLGGAQKLRLDLALAQFGKTLADRGSRLILRKGLALGAWGAAQATAAGLSIFIGGALRDAVNALATNGALGEALQSATTGYSVVYHIEIGLLFVTLIALGPLVRVRPVTEQTAAPTGLAEFPT